MSENNDVWAVVELMGHITLAGRVTKPGEYGGLWQIDIPEGETYHTQFFGSQSVYRIRMVSEEIARAYATPSHDVIEYDCPIVTREQHLEAMRLAEEKFCHLQTEIQILRQKLIAVDNFEIHQQLPSGEVDQG